MDIDLLKRKVLQEAANRRIDAGYGGEWSDRGASALEDQVNYYTMGQRGEVPKTWLAFKDVKLKEEDPDWELFKRLQEKFKDRV